MIAEWVRAAAALRSPVSTMQAMIGMAMETGPWVAGSVIVGSNRSSMCTAAYLDARAAECDRLQLHTGEGPVHDAVRMDPPQTATDLAEDPRWPCWSTAALRLGIRRAFAVRLFTTRTWGTLNLYAAHPGKLDIGVVREAQLIAAHASPLLANIVTEGQLRRAMSTRGVIGQAQGILMHRFGIDADSAFAALRGASQQHNAKIVVIAEHVIATGECPGSFEQGETFSRSHPHQVARTKEST